MKYILVRLALAVDKDAAFSEVKWFDSFDDAVDEMEKAYYHWLPNDKSCCAEIDLKNGTAWINAFPVQKYWRVFREGENGADYICHIFLPFL